MSPLNPRFLATLIEAKKMEQEAMMMLLPEKMQGHMKVISKEIKAMVFETLMEYASAEDESTATVCDEPSKSEDQIRKKEQKNCGTTRSNIKKINIG